MELIIRHIVFVAPSKFFTDSILKTIWIAINFVITKATKMMNHVFDGDCFLVVNKVWDVFIHLIIKWEEIFLFQ